MLYLIEDRDYLKIGYSKNLNERLKAYELHNCYAKLIDSKPGTPQDETNIQELCKDYLYKGEWFYNTSKVKQIFQNYCNLNSNEIYQYKSYVTIKALSILKNWNTLDASLIYCKYNDISLLEYFDTAKQKHEFENKLSQLVNENYNNCQITDWYYYSQNQDYLVEIFLKNHQIKYDYLILPNVYITRDMQLEFLEKKISNIKEEIFKYKQILLENQELKENKYFKELTTEQQTTIQNNIITIDSKLSILNEEMDRLIYFLKTANL